MRKKRHTLWPCCINNYLTSPNTTHQINKNVHYAKYLIFFTFNYHQHFNNIALLITEIWSMTIIVGVKIFLPADSICCLRSRSCPLIGKYLVNGLCLSLIGFLFLLSVPTSKLISLVSDNGLGDSAFSDSSRDWNNKKNDLKSFQLNRFFMTRLKRLIITD